MIKPVKEIPGKDKKPSVKDQIRSDIRTALEERCPAFEFVGYEKKDTLAGYVRQTAREMWRKHQLEYPTIAGNIMKEQGLYYRAYVHEDAWFTVTGRTEGDEKKVYMRIDFAYLDGYEKMIENEARLMKDQVDRNANARARLTGAV